jgi:hypothetical protein
VAPAAAGDAGIRLRLGESVPEALRVCLRDAVRDEQVPCAGRRAQRAHPAGRICPFMSICMQRAAYKGG